MADQSSPLLINESPLQVLPSLVVALGNVHEAIILQQVQYWLRNPKSGRTGEDGHRYVRDTYEEWQEQMPWLSIRTIKDRIKSLETKGVLLTANLNKSKYDRTKWYSINYENLNALMHSEVTSQSKVNQLHNQRGSSFTIKGEVTSQSKVNQLHNQRGSSFTIKSESSYQPIPKTSTKTSTEISNNKYNVQEQSSVDYVPDKEIIDYLNKKTGKHYRYTSKANQRLIRARWNDGYKLDDFKKVIDNKCFEWQGTKMATYLRPETLFNATKFESYLNESNVDERFPQGGGFAGLDTGTDDSPLNDIDDDDLPF